MEQETVKGSWWEDTVPKDVEKIAVCETGSGKARL
jgi:hypothetical protein